MHDLTVIANTDILQLFHVIILQEIGQRCPNHVILNTIDLIDLHLY